MITRAAVKRMRRAHKDQAAGGDCHPVWTMAMVLQPKEAADLIDFLIRGRAPNDADAVAMLLREAQKAAERYT